jgi:hypothetical protein
VLLAGWLAIQTDITPTLPSGWTTIKAGVDSIVRVGRFNIAFLVRGASAPDLTWTHSSVASSLFVYRLPGVFSTGDPNDATATQVDDITANPHTFSGLTTATDNSAVIAIAMRRSAISQGSASTYTERLDMTGDFFVMADLKATAGATGNPEFTESDDNDTINVLIALKEAPPATVTQTQPPANIRHSEGGKRRNWDKTGWFNTRASKNDWFWRGWPVTTTSGVTGTLARTNANDTSAASGATTIVGTLARTNANDTSAATGTTTILGALAKTNANDTSAASGTTTVTGTVSKTNNNDSVAASGSVGASVTGTLATTNANDTLAGTGTTTVTGTFAKTNANDASAASGTTTVTGTVARTNANDSVSASGIVGAPTGTVNYTNNNDTVVASGVVTPPTVTATAGVGAPDHRGMRRFSAKINDKMYYFNSLEELQFVLNSFKTKQKKKIAKKVERTVIPVTIPQIEVPTHVPMWAVQEIQKANASLEAYYWQQYELLMQQDDDEAIVALYG